MKAWLKWTLIVIGCLFVIGAAIVLWVYNKPHRNIASETAIAVNTDTLIHAFIANEKKANTLYLDKVVSLVGVVQAVSKNSVNQWVVNIKPATGIGSITAVFTAEQKQIQPSDSIAYKGICTGFFPEENNVVINEAALLYQGKTTMKITTPISFVSGKKDTLLTFTTSNGSIKFSSPTDPDVSAINTEVSSKIDAAGDIHFSLLFKGFRFKYAEMQTHFNEEYIESQTYPRATFTGRIQNSKNIDFTKDGRYTVTIVGSLTMHGVTKPLSTNGLFYIKNGKITATASFGVLMADFNIDASAVTEKVDLEISCNYTPL
jgi:polyisoprenoid-binding protein YceI